MLTRISKLVLPWLECRPTAQRYEFINSYVMTPTGIGAVVDILEKGQKPESLGFISPKTYKRFRYLCAQELAKRAGMRLGCIAKESDYAHYLKQLPENNDINHDIVARSLAAEILEDK